MVSEIVGAQINGVQIVSVRKQFEITNKSPREKI